MRGLAVSSARIGASVFAPTDQFEDRHLGPSAAEEVEMLQVCMYWVGGWVGGWDEQTDPIN